MYVNLYTCVPIEALGGLLGTCSTPVRGGVGGTGVAVTESAYTCYSMIYGVSVPPYTPVLVAYSVSALHTITHTHTRHHCTPTQRQGVDNQLICYGTVRLAYEHVHDDELHCTKATTLFCRTTKSDMKRIG